MGVSFAEAFGQMLRSRVIIVSDHWRTTDLWSQSLKDRGVQVELVDFSAYTHHPELLDRNDLAIVDVNECDEAGTEICRNIRDRSYIPLLVLTYDTDERVHLKYYAEGIDECIRKPIGPALLLAKINAWLYRMALCNGGLSTKRHSGYDLDDDLRRLAPD